MPQVYFSTKTFTGREVLPDYTAYVHYLNRTHLWMKFIDDPMNLSKIDGFDIAYAQDFDNFHLHHKGGQYLSKKELIARFKYYKQKPEYLMFIPASAHIRLHCILNEIESQVTM